MQELIQTIKGENYSSIHPRAFEHDGCIIDLGCASWNWSSIFIGKKRLIGIDPFEKHTPLGAELLNAIIGPFNGISWMNYDGFNSKVMQNGILNQKMNLFNVFTWRKLCDELNINNISILKMNIEGAEYPLLSSMDKSDFEKIDQIIVSFHDWMNPMWSNLTLSSIYLLEKSGFELQVIDSTYNWVLGLKK